MIRSYKHREYLKAAQFVWAAFVFIIHVMPVDRDDIRRFDFPYADKWIHGLLFCVLASLSYMVTSKRRSVTISLVLVFSACIAYGGLLELIQLVYTEERSGDALDWLADASGTIVGLILTKVISDRIILRS